MAADGINTTHPQAVFLNLASSVSLRHFSKILCGLTLFLIFAGALVKSTNSGLAVPDWPLSYGMLFPPMIGGVFYEHGHRMIAGTVGFLTLIMTILVWRWEPRTWIRKLYVAALLAVILQGILGGITVLFFLPTSISVSHGVLAQIFLLLIFTGAYAFSSEHQQREAHDTIPSRPPMIRLVLLLEGLIFLQLIAGAVMRHTESGLAIPDFPKMGGYWIPRFNAVMLERINHWRFLHNLDFVTMPQVIYHFAHRLGAFLIVLALIALNFYGLSWYRDVPSVIRLLSWLNGLVVIQILFGILTVLTIKEPYTTSVHVVFGATLLALNYLLLLRISPLKWRQFVRCLQNENFS